MQGQKKVIGHEKIYLVAFLKCLLRIMSIKWISVIVGVNKINVIIQIKG